MDSANIENSPEANSKRRNPAGSAAHSSETDVEAPLSLQQRICILEDRISSTNQPAEPNASRIANVGPLGLFAFGYTTALLSANFTKWASDGTEEFTYGFGLFFGGLVQLLAGMWAIWARNTFAGTAFSSYGGFWLGFSIHGILVSGGVLTGMEAEGEQTVLAIWAIFTFCLFLQTFNINIALLLLFLFLTLAFALLAAGPKHPRVVKAGGYFGEGAAFMAFYTGLAELTNEVYRRPIMPMGVLNVINVLPSFKGARPDTL